MTTLQLVFILLVLIALSKDQEEYGEQLITLTSWYRDPARNAAVGGREGSLHPAGLALDFTTAPLGSTVSNVINGLACGVGGLFGLCRERPLFNKENTFKRLAPPVTQAIFEGDHTHFELDLT